MVCEVALALAGRGRSVLGELEALAFQRVFGGVRGARRGMVRGSRRAASSKACSGRADAYPAPLPSTGSAASPPALIGASQVLVDRLTSHGSPQAGDRGASGF
jgi:hypothetical protein